MKLVRTAVLVAVLAVPVAGATTPASACAGIECTKRCVNNIVEGRYYCQL